MNERDCLFFIMGVLEGSAEVGGVSDTTRKKLLQTIRGVTSPVVVLDTNNIVEEKLRATVLGKNGSPQVQVRPSEDLGAYG